MASIIRCAIMLSAMAIMVAAPPAFAQESKPASKSKPAAEAKSGKSGTKSGAKSAAKSAPVAAGGGSQPSLVGQFAGWGAYSAAVAGRKVCFALAKPSSSKTNPASRPRDPSYLFVATRPNEKVKDEVSVSIGYQFKPGSEASLEAGGARFALYTQSDGAWIKNAAEEGRMVDAMRKAADAVIKGVSAKGTESTDTFSLKGLAQALDRLAQECR